MKRLFVLFALCTSVASAQTVYVPSGTAGIGSSTTANVGIGTNAPADQLEVVSTNRKVGLNTPIAGITPGGILSLSRPSDGLKTMYFGTAPTSTDGVIFTQGGNTELRLVSAGATSNGFGFYLNTNLATSFGATRPTPAIKIDGTGSLGIGTATPSSKLHVVGAGTASAVDMRITGRIMTGDATNTGGVWLGNGSTMLVGQNGANQMGFFHTGIWRMVVNSNGSVGIGNTSPTTRLDVTGSGGSTVDFRVNGRMTTGDAGNLGGIYLNGSQTMLLGQNSATTLGFYVNNAWRMLIDNSGNVGIGTTTIDAKLAVKGQIHAQEVKVDLAGSVAPDYVFDSNYQLPSLEKLKAYIVANHHLPEVPSAKQMEEEGIQLKEMNLLLLRKIEELTLYMLKQGEEIELLKKEVEGLTEQQAQRK